MNVILADDTALRLARLGIELEERFGGPRDIEFAVAKVTFCTYSYIQLQKKRNFERNVP